MNKKSLKRWVARVIRVLTLPSVMSALLFTILYFNTRIFGSVWEYLAAIAFLSLLPSSAYALQPILPHFKNKGRNGQRTLAMIMSCAGYVLSVVYGFVFSVSIELLTVFITYLMSGIVLLILNKVFGIKASGHASGLAGPVAVLSYFGGLLPLLCGGCVFALSMWSALKIKRHTAAQFVAGACVPTVIFFAIYSIM